MDFDNYSIESNSITQSNLSSYNEYSFDPLSFNKKRISRRRQIDSSTAINKPIEEYQFNEVFPGININAPIKINRINSIKNDISSSIVNKNIHDISDSLNEETSSYNNFSDNQNSLSGSVNSINENETNYNDGISSVTSTKSINDLKLKRKITPTLISSPNNSLPSSNNLSSQNYQKRIPNRNKDPYDFLPIVDFETENRLKLLPKPIYKYIPKSPISTNSEDENNKSNEENDNEEFLQFVEPSEEELINRVEYDMDEQDMIWLKKINQLRKQKGLEIIEPIFFERVMDKLEKEWFDLNKNLPSEKNEQQSSEDSVCEICNNGECENSNAIVFCDGCNIAVHQDCYGVPFIPEGQWLCRKCMISPEAQVSCVLCPNKGGAFKQTDFNCWAHLSCAIWIPECSQANIVYMEPIINIEKIPRSRWSLLCYLCKKPMGACIQCSRKLCCTAFHVTCAKAAGLYLEFEKNGGMDNIECRAYCDKHTPNDYKYANNVSESVRKYKIKCSKELSMIKKAKHRNLLSYRLNKRNAYIAEEIFKGKEDDYDITKAKADVIMNSNLNDIDNETSSSISCDSLTAKSNNVHSIPYENFLSGKWVIPKSIAEKIINSLCKSNDKQQKRQFIIDVAKYWSLKRESRGGASLLKRLHIEPWSAYSTLYINSGNKKLKTLEVLATIRSSLEKMRTIAKMIIIREKRKLLQTKIQKRIIETIHFPISALVRPIFYDIKKNDKEEVFWFPVNPEEVEDYYDIIKHPMSFDIIENKIDTFKYKSVQEFKDDMDLIWSNAMLYNKEETVYYMTAVKLKNRINRLIKPVFEEEQILSKQKMKALRIKLPQNFWDIEFSLSKPIESLEYIDSLSRRKDKLKDGEIITKNNEKLNNGYKNAKKVNNEINNDIFIEEDKMDYNKEITNTPLIENDPYDSNQQNMYKNILSTKSKNSLSKKNSVKTNLSVNKQNNLVNKDKDIEVDENNENKDDDNIKDDETLNNLTDDENSILDINELSEEKLSEKLKLKETKDNRKTDVINIIPSVNIKKSKNKSKINEDTLIESELSNNNLLNSDDQSIDENISLLELSHNKKSISKPVNLSLNKNNKKINNEKIVYISEDESSTSKKDKNEKLINNNNNNNNNNNRKIKSKGKNKNVISSNNLEIVESGKVVNKSNMKNDLENSKGVIEKQNIENNKKETITEKKNIGSLKKENKQLNVKSKDKIEKNKEKSNDDSKRLTQSKSIIEVEDLENKNKKKNDKNERKSIDKKEQIKNNDGKAVEFKKLDKLKESIEDNEDFINPSLFSNNRKNKINRNKMKELINDNENENDLKESKNDRSLPPKSKKKGEDKNKIKEIETQLKSVNEKQNNKDNMKDVENSNNENDEVETKEKKQKSLQKDTKNTRSNTKTKKGNHTKDDLEKEKENKKHINNNIDNISNDDKDNNNELENIKEDNRDNSRINTRNAGRRNSSRSSSRSSSSRSSSKNSSELNNPEISNSQKEIDSEESSSVDIYDSNRSEHYSLRRKSKVKPKEIMVINLLEETKNDEKKKQEEDKEFVIEIADANTSEEGKQKEKLSSTTNKDAARNRRRKQQDNSPSPTEINGTSKSRKRKQEDLVTKNKEDDNKSRKRKQVEKTSSPIENKDTKSSKREKQPEKISNSFENEDIKPNKRGKQEEKVSKSTESKETKSSKKEKQEEKVTITTENKDTKSNRKRRQEEKATSPTNSNDTKSNRKGKEEEKVCSPTDNKNTKSSKKGKQDEEEESSSSEDKNIKSRRKRKEEEKVSSSSENKDTKSNRKGKQEEKLSISTENKSTRVGRKRKQEEKISSLEENKETKTNRKSKEDDNISSPESNKSKSNRKIEEKQEELSSSFSTTENKSKRRGRKRKHKEENNDENTEMSSSSTNSTSSSNSTNSTISTNNELEEITETSGVSEINNRKHRRKRFKGDLVKAPSSSTKVKEIKLSEDEMYNIKLKAVKQFKTTLDSQDKLSVLRELDNNKEWLTYLACTCNADVKSDLVKRTHRRLWVWQRI